MNQTSIQFGRRIFVQGGLVVGLSGLFGRALAAPASPFTEIVHDRLSALAALKSLPAVTQGSGPVVYALISQNSPACQALWKDLKKSKTAPAVEFHWIPLALPADNQKQVSLVAVSGSVEDLDQYMAKTLKTDGIPEDQRRTDALSTDLGSGKVIEQIAAATGISTDTPQFFWEKDGKLEATAGYTAKGFRAMVHHITT